jgi:hypothetical protein
MEDCMKRVLIAAVLVTALMSLSLAQDKTEKKEMPKGHTMTGYLVDQMCAKRITKNDVETATKKAAKHKKECALEDACKESGYGMIIDGKWTKFTDDGDKKATKFLEKSSKKDNFLVDVTGTMDGDKMDVTSIKDTKVEKKHTTKESK